MPLILIVDDEEDIRWSLKRILKDKSYQFLEADSGKAALQIIAKTIPDLVLLDLRMPEMDGYKTIQQLLRLEPGLAILVLTGIDSVKSAVQAMKLGANDYLVKPVDHDELRLVVRKTLEGKGWKRHASELDQQFHSSHYLIGKNPRMQQLQELVKNLADRDVSVLIEGDSGTGKQVLAEALHHLSSRRNGPFVTVDCGAIPENLMESECFGFERGAFTGAESRKIGKFEMAKGGTLFLDEISNMSVSLQAKLLRVLETKQFERLGSTSSLTADFRLVTASNTKLLEQVQKGEFRNDLYYRINVFKIEVPPLCERKEDIPELADYFLKLFNRKHDKNVERVSDECLKLFGDFSWPGNLRQLRNVIERAVLLTDDVILPSHLPSEINKQTSATAIEKESSDAEGDLDSLEEQALRRALKKHRWDKTRAAAELGISLRTLYYWLKRYNIRQTQAN